MMGRISVTALHLSGWRHMTRALLLLAGVNLSVEFFYCAFCNGKEKHHPLKYPLSGELGLKLIDISGGNCGSSLDSTPLAGVQGGALPATPLAAAPAVVVPRLRRLKGLHLPRLVSRSRWRRVMRASQIAFARMGMMTGWILNLMGLFPCTPRLLSVLSDPLLPLPLLLLRPVLGCPWSRRCLGPPMVGLFINRPCQMQTLCWAISSFLQALCLLCTGLSPLRSLWRAFDW